jgi:hypothetical protein
MEINRMISLRASLLAVVPLGVGALVIWIQHQALTKVRDENMALQQRVSQLAMAAESNRICQMRVISTGEVSSNDTVLSSELNHLRGEADAQNAEIAKLRDQIAAITIEPPPTNFPFSMMFVNIPKQAWANVGYDTPENALETAVWAASVDDLNSMMGSLTSNAQQKLDEFSADAISGLMSAATDLQILKSETQSDNRMHFTVYFDGLDTSNQPNWIDLSKVGDQWKVDYW